MTGVAVNVTAQGQDEVLRVFRALMDAGEKPGPFLRPLGTQLLRSTRDRAAREVDPEGNAWPALSEDYAKRKSRTTMLRRSGVLLGGLTREVEGFDLLLGSDEVYAARHQFGFESTPARTYLGISAEDVELIQEEWEDFVARRAG